MFKEEQCRQLLHESTQKLAEIIAQGQAKEHDLLPLPARQQQVQQELEEHAKTVEMKMYEGLRAIVLALKDCQNPVVPFIDLVHELQRCIHAIDSPEAFSKFGQALLSETSWKNQLGISDKLMSALYQGAKIVFEKREYEQAEKAFFVLCSLDSSQFKYWIGLGHAAFQGKNYTQAVTAYGMASALRPDDVWPHIWAANAFEAQKDVIHAKIALSDALSLAKTMVVQNHDLVRTLETKLQVLR